MQGIHQNTMTKINKRLKTVFNQFTEESIGNCKINVMPTQDRIPEIKKIGFDKINDIFELVFFEYENNEFKKNSKGNIIFIENNEGHLMAIQILQFSKMNIEQIKIKIITSIEDRIESLEMQLKTKDSKTNIPESIVDKRKLLFMKDVLKIDHSKLKEMQLQR